MLRPQHDWQARGRAAVRFIIDCRHSRADLERLRSVRSGLQGFEYHRLLLAGTAASDSRHTVSKVPAGIVACFGASLGSLNLMGAHHGIERQRSTS